MIALSPAVPPPQDRDETSLGHMFRVASPMIVATISYTLHVVFVGFFMRWRFRGNLWQDLDILRYRSEGPKNKADPV